MAGRQAGFTTATAYNYVGEPRFARMIHPDGTPIVADIDALPDNWREEGFTLVEVLEDGPVPEGFAPVATGVAALRPDHRFLTPQERAGFAQARAEVAASRADEAMRVGMRNAELHEFGRMGENVKQLQKKAESMRTTVESGKALPPTEHAVVAEAGNATDETMTVTFKASGVRDDPEQTAPIVSEGADGPEARETRARGRAAKD